MPELRFWFAVWLGVVGAGGAFGMLIGGLGFLASADVLLVPAGALIGALIAALLGAFVTFTLGMLVWVTWLSRVRIYVAAGCGTLTALIATIGFLQSGFGGFVFSSAAVVMGTLGARLAALRYLTHSPTGNALAAADQARTGRITLQEMLTHTAGVAVLLALWTAIFRLFTR